MHATWDEKVWSQFFKTPPTFISSPFQSRLIAKKTKKERFFGIPFIMHLLWIFSIWCQFLAILLKRCNWKVGIPYLQMLYFGLNLLLFCLILLEVDCPFQMTSTSCVSLRKDRREAITPSSWWCRGRVNIIMWWGEMEIYSPHQTSSVSFTICLDILS